jgi:hypothetical protein
VNEPPVDAERIAALLDGRLDARARTEVLAQLAASPEALDAFVDATVALRELSPDDAQAPGGSARFAAQPTSGWGRRPGRWLALAAAIAGIAVAPWAWQRLRAPEPDVGVRFAVLLPTEQGGLPPAWDGRPWSVTRGAADALTPEMRATRLGARLTDLDVAVRGGDSSAAACAVADVGALLDGVPAGAPVAALYRDVARHLAAAPSELQPLLARGATAAAQVAGEELVALGAWLEAGRLAAARRDAAFFRAPASRAQLARARASSTLSDASRASVARIEAMVAAGPSDWGALSAELTALLRGVAG